MPEKRRFEELRHFISRLETSSHEEYGDIMLERNKMEEDTIELVANQIYDRITTVINDRRKRLSTKGGANLEEPTVRDYNSFNLDDNGNLNFTYKNKVINLDNINEDLKTPSAIIKELGVNRLKLLGFRNKTDEDVNSSRSRYRKAREKVRKLNDNLDERSKEIESSSTTVAEAIEMMEMTSKDIDKTVEVVEQDMSFIQPGERDKVLPLRELQGLDKELRTIRGFLKIAIAKRVDLKSRTEHKERKLSEVQDPNYTDDQIIMIKD